MSMSKPPTKLDGLHALRSVRSQLKQHSEQHALRQQQDREAEQKIQAEADLFRNAIKEVKPLKQSQRATQQLEKPLPIPRQHLHDKAHAVQESISDEMAIERLLETDSTESYRRADLSPDLLRKLRRGHWAIQDEIDLHGLRRDEARALLGAFLREFLKQGHRCVRIIHGKGHGSANREPVLKNKVRVWLVQKEEVLAFCPAKAADGGSGALIVLLQGSAS